MSAAGQGARGWLLDTDVVSELRRGRRCHPGVRAWAETVPPGACFLSRVTLAEIRFGIERAADPAFRAELEAWLRDGVRAWFGGPVAQRLHHSVGSPAAMVLDVDENVPLAWRRLAWAGQKANDTYAQPDGLLAATALVHGLGVVTRNTADSAPTGVALFDPWTT